MISHLAFGDGVKIGFYMLINVKTYETYFGSGILGECWRRHFNAYLNKNHYNGKLQEAFNRTPEGWEFIPTVVEEYSSSDENRLDARAYEQGAITEEWDNPLLLNLSKSAYACRPDYDDEQRKRHSVAGKNFYANGGINPMLGKKLSDAHKEKISLNTLKRYEDPDERKKHSELVSGERNGFYGKHHSDETKNILSNFGKERFANSDIREKLIHKQTERMKNPELRELSKIGAIKQWEDPEMREKLCLKVSIDGIIYESTSSASRALNIAYSTIRSRLTNDNFKSWFFV
jgi:group I intron endonuclease